MTNLLKIDPKSETKKITDFIKHILKKNGFERVVIGLSGGIDSSTVLCLLARSLKPSQIFAVHIPYDKEYEIQSLLKAAKIPSGNFQMINIKQSVDAIAKQQGI